ncbi:Uncharacterized membrane protein YckC, RDD family [Dokdonella immobilis]|uniref:Uncharacterized membrane protein YckC, RDD family n=2 Tax=Dokdonella immobilis TaxID=578942 RepID=A0A1I4WVF5_9GAMM|nr:Uncharacterized membrane protein YckC, RDD family [Dokdonella immobilis]
MNTFESAPLWRRLAALLYDALVLVAIWMGAAALVLLAFRGEVDVAHQPPLYHFVLQGVLLVLTALYFIVSWTRGGQTIGMRAWRVSILDAKGHFPDTRRSLARFLLATGSALLLGVGFVWCLFDPDRRALHDILARTRMVHLHKPDA